MKRFFLVLIVFLLKSCAVFQPRYFSKLSLNENLLTLKGENVSFESVLKKGEGKTIFIQFFTSYCPVSQDSFEDVLVLQQNYKDVSYVFLSLDHTFLDWKKGLEYVKPEGQFYYVPQKEKGDLGTFLNLKTIPRFLVIDKTKKIKEFNSSRITNHIKNQLMK